MKKRELHKLMSKYGWVLLRCNGHEIWGNGIKTVAVPRGRDVKSGTAHGIIKLVKEEIKNV